MFNTCFYISNIIHLTMTNSNKLAGKNVLITAGAQGIGEAITQHFIDSGANVAIHYFSKFKLFYN